MENVRPQFGDWRRLPGTGSEADRLRGEETAEGGRGRFNVLLTEDRVREDEHWINQLSRLLQPLGVQMLRARSGREAIDMAGQIAIHAAVIDLSTPRDAAAAPARSSVSAPPAGLWLLEFFSRLPNRPPVVVLRKPSYSRREAERMLGEALRLGAFSVLDKPIGVEHLLNVFQRLIDRTYQGMWPPDKPSGN